MLELLHCHLLYAYCTIGEGLTNDVDALLEAACTSTVHSEYLSTCYANAVEFIDRQWIVAWLQ